MRPPSRARHRPGYPAPASGPGAGWIILPLLLLVALAGGGYLLLHGRMGGQPGAGAPVAATGATGGTGSGSPAVPAAPSVPAAVIDSAFASDPTGASLRYPGPVTVTGAIATGVQPGPDALSIEGRTRLNFLIARFPSGYSA